MPTPGSGSSSLARSRQSRNARPATRASSACRLVRRRPGASNGRTQTSTRIFPIPSAHCSTRSRAPATTTTSATWASPSASPEADWRRWSSRCGTSSVSTARRMYYNLTSIHAVLRSAPCGELLTSSFNQFVGSDATDTAAAVPLAQRAADRARQAAEVTRVVFQTIWQYASVERRVERFERRIDAFASRTHPEALRQRTLQDLLEDFRAFLQIRCRQWNDAALADAGSMVCYGVLQRLLARAFPEEDQQALHNSLLKALPGLVSGQPAIELWTLSEQVRSNHALSQLFVWADPSAVLDAVAHDERFCRIQTRDGAISGAVGFPVLRRAHADGPELPGGCGAARGADSKLPVGRRRVPAPGPSTSGRATRR